METLFKFVLVRQAVEQADDAPSISLAQETPLQRALSDVQEEAGATQARRRAARALVTSPEFVADQTALALSAQWAALAKAFDEAERSNDLIRAALVESVELALGESISVVAGGKELADDLRRLRDSILAVKLLPEEHHRPIHRLAQTLRDIEALLALARNTAFPSDANHLRRYRRRAMRLPIGSVKSGRVSSSTLRSPRTPRKPDTDAARRQAANVELARVRALSAAAEELGRVPPEVLALTPLQASPEYIPPSSALSAASTEERPVGEGGTSAFVTARSVAGPRRSFAGRSPLTAENLGRTGFRIAKEAAASLTKETAGVLEALNLSPLDHAVDEMTERLRREVAVGVRNLDRLAGRPVHLTLKRFGGVVVIVKTPIASEWTDLVLGGPYELALPPAPSGSEPRVPDSHGVVAPAGIADLLVVKQQLLRYEGVEVAHIENVLQGERKQRDHRRRRETEQFTLRETEVTTSEERELETTDRFEMVRETNETLRESAAFAAGLTISGRYGPSVEFSASADGAISRDREHATKTASTFSKETTYKSASKIAERVLQRETLRVTTSVEEANSHVLDNVGGGGHVRGTYQWIEKVYRAQMYNYGLRLLYDFVLPEPAAFVIEALKRGHANAVEIEKPMRFALRADQITELNYQSWVLEYHATDVDPPPEPYITKTLDYAAGGGDEETDYNHSAQIALDDGYRAVHASVGITGNVWNADASVDVIIGQRANRLLNAGYRIWHTPLDSERGSVPFALNTFRQSDLAVAVEVKTQRTEAALGKWRQATHAKLTLAYRARLAEYEEKLAALKAEAGVAIRGTNPATNLDVMNAEIRKACISVLTDQHFELFNAVELGTNGFPQIDLDENAAEGPYVRFFEQAFEWDQLTWLTYPYFWGRKSEWAERIAFEDGDPLFAQFLKAGYCRAVVPVRPGFEGAVDHFITFGEPWMGGSLPPISSPQYLPIADEIAERLDRPGDEVAVGEPWEVRIPTNLVRLRDDGSLPSWRQDPDGNWFPE